jgi:hypothetical protein
MNNGLLGVDSQQAQALAARIADYEAAIAAHEQELLEDLDYFENKLADLTHFHSARCDELRVFYSGHISRIRKLLSALRDGCPKMWDRYPE